MIEDFMLAANDVARFAREKPPCCRCSIASMKKPDAEKLAMFARIFWMASA